MEKGRIRANIGGWSSIGWVMATGAVTATAREKPETAPYPRRRPSTPGPKESKSGKTNKESLDFLSVG
jgi:hypothetical protein